MEKEKKQKIGTTAEKDRKVKRSLRLLQGHNSTFAPDRETRAPKVRLQHLPAYLPQPTPTLDTGGQELT